MGTGWVTEQDFSSSVFKFVKTYLGGSQIVLLINPLDCTLIISQIGWHLLQYTQCHQMYRTSLIKQEVCQIWAFLSIVFIIEWAHITFSSSLIMYSLVRTILQSPQYESYSSNVEVNFATNVFKFWKKLKMASCHNFQVFYLYLVSLKVLHIEYLF